MEAKDLQYCIHPSELAGEDEGGNVITFAPIEYWKEHECLPDYHFSDELSDDLVPEGYAWIVFREETMWFTRKSESEIREDLNKLGMTESLHMRNFLTDCFE